MACTYMLRSADGSFYCGSTEQLDARIAKHQDGSASVGSAARRPVTLVYAEAHSTIAVARRRERQLKGWSRAKKAALISANHRDLKRLGQSSRTRERSAAVAPLTEDHPIFRLVGAGRGGGDAPGARDKHAILGT